MSAHGPMPRSAWIFPALAVLFFAAATASGLSFTPSVAGLTFATGLLVILFGTVFAAVHHAEMIAERIGEPYGTLLLTLAVTIIEVALIATIMLGDKEVPTLARDTVFAVVMIVCNGLVGICIFIGGLRYREQDFQVTGANLYLSVLFVLATITLIMPNYTLTTPGPIYSAAQLGFVSVVTLILYGVFLYTQTIRIAITSSATLPGPRRAARTFRTGCSP
jgi:Ca2+:H+ antiporter